MGVWDWLEIVGGWIWDFGLRLVLEFGIWNLEFGFRCIEMMERIFGFFGFIV